MTANAFEKIAAGLEDAVAFAEGRADPADYVLHAPVGVDVKAIRKGRRLSQEAFAARYHRQSRIDSTTVFRQPCSRGFCVGR